MTTRSGFPDGVARANPAIDQAPGPNCIKCGMPTFKRDYERDVGIPVDKLTERIVEFRCGRCDLNFAPDPKDGNKFVPIPLCDFCKKPVQGIFEIRSETTTDCYELNAEGAFVYTGGDVDNDDPLEEMHNSCSEYPGDPAIDWYHDKKDESSNGENH